MKKIYKINVLVMFAILFSLNSNAQIINTIAGNGVAGAAGDGSAAISAQLNVPYGVAIDAIGNLYIADMSNHKIRKVNTSGIITTFAGTGVQGYSGDGAAATSAKLAGPTGVAVDALGNVYIADNSNNRIRKVNTSGIITTIAGIGGANGFTGDGGAATAAKLGNPWGLTLDKNGNIYFSDSQNHRIRKINTSGIISTIAGIGSNGFSGDGSAATSAMLNLPCGVAIDTIGNVYIADRNNRRVRKVDITGIITTFAGTGVTGYSGDGGAATSAQLSSHYGIGIDEAGNIYIGDTNNGCVRKVNTTGIISTMAGIGTLGYSGDGGAATSAQLNSPTGIAFDYYGNAYIADLNNDRIRKVTCVSPTVIINSTKNSVCLGDTLTLSSSGASSYTWTGGITSGVSFTPTTTQTYTVTGLANNGCKARTTKTITVNPLPTLSAITNNTLLCTGQTASLSVTGASTYTWSTNENTSTIVVSPTVQTTYTVDGTDSNGCSNLTTITQSVSLCTGINQLSSNNYINVFPNPFNNQITVILNNTNQLIQIYNSLGSIVHSATIDKDQVIIDLRNHSSGFYFIKIGSVTKKIIKE
ncbi:MAG: T9SS type A sorting domain-containing protein [Bacteroidetes bacterium]|nr:T9SS type A sorting domain-containing protein [Bacteroidota bacterium]